MADEHATKTQLSGKVALITGGARGLGGAQARLFVERGARVLIGDVLEDLASELASELGENARSVLLDVTHEEHWNSAIRTGESEFGKLDVLINNAGISPAPGPIIETPAEDYERVIRVNQIGSFLALRATIPAMQRAGGGSIVLIGSTAAVEGVGGMAPYVSSKHAVRGLAHVAALECAREGIRVNTILPGPMDTFMNQPGGWWEGVDLRPDMAQGNPMGRIGAPRECAELAAFLASDASSYCTGGDFSVDGGQLAGVYAPPITR
ncbi:glucose 1-dehydrogenase [Myxococcota bacterium]|nr:glucose 1-dehydrogenase [Myxococcota bacterium]